MIRIWIDKDTVEQNTTEDGDFVLRIEDIYFFRRSEIANEEGYHLEFNSNGDGGFELYLPYRDFRTLYNLIARKLMEYAETNKES